MILILINTLGILPADTQVEYTHHARHHWHLVFPIEPHRSQARRPFAKARQQRQRASCTSHWTTLTIMLAAQYPQPVPQPQAAQLRTNEDVNFSVLHRHNNNITSIISIAPYAVVYTFSTATQTWEKAAIEGSLFVCQLAPTYNSSPVYNSNGNPSTPLPIEHYAVHVLNRRALDNFALELYSPDSIEITPDYIILQGTSAAVVPFPPAEDLLDGDGVNAAEEESVIYGLWVYPEPPPASTAIAREVNARVIVDCATRAEESRRLATAEETDTMIDDTFEDDDAYDEARKEQDQAHEEPEEGTYQDVQPAAVNESSTRTDKEMNLQKLLGLFSAPTPAKTSVNFQVPEQYYTPQQTYPPQQQQQQLNQGNPTFPQHSQHYPQQPQYPQQNTNAQQNVLLDLFSRARQGPATG